MKCRIGCGACCIATSISSPIPGLPHGKPARMRCPHLTEENRCSIHHTAEYPQVCQNLTPSEEMCGSTFEEAFAYLENLEHLTRPDSL